MESTFLGLWIFGWGRLSKKAHLTCAWLVFVGVNTSALWIIGANSWMQHPVGATFDPETGRAQLDGLSGFFQVLLNPVLWAAYTHVLTTSWLLVGTFVAGIAIWWMVRSANAGAETEARDIWRPIARFGMVVMIVGGLLTAVTGHIQGQLVAKDQPAKMAAAEALCETPNAGQGAPFTIAAFGPLDATCKDITKIGEVPGVYSFMATNSFTGKVEGLDTLNQKYGSMFSEILSQRGYDMHSQPVDFSPNIIFSFWSFRLMMLFGIFSANLVFADALPRHHLWLAIYRMGSSALHSASSRYGSRWILGIYAYRTWALVRSPRMAGTGYPAGLHAYLPGTRHRLVPVD